MFAKLRRFILWRILAAGILISRSVHTFRSNNLDDDCLWEENAFSPRETPRVMRVRAECSAGELIWHRPYGGLRVTFHPREIKGHFKLCIKSKHSEINIYNEGLQDVRLLQAMNDKPNRRICVNSKKEHLVLFIESSKKDAHTMKLKYTVHAKRKHGRRSPRVCKPCSVLKLIKTMCNSDFVVKGHVASTYSVSDSRDTQASIITKNILYQRHSIFVKPKQGASHYKASIRIPKGCSWKKKKQKSYWITGKVEPGKGAVMTCYVKDETWLKLETLKRLYKKRCGRRFSSLNFPKT